MSVKVGQTIPIEADKRYIQHVRSHAIGDVYDALVELITNADDSYNNLFVRKRRTRDGGDILIEHLEQRKGRSCIVVRDKAEGMDSSDMEKSFVRMGAFTSEWGNRGYMGRPLTFVKALFQIPSERLRALLAKDREQDKDQRREIANKETQTRLSRLAKLAGQYLREQLDELEELTGGDAVDDTSFSKQGVLLYPTYLRVGVGKERSVTYDVKRSLLSSENEPVTIKQRRIGRVEDRLNDP